MTENKEKWENSRIISSDDPNALEKLRKKLESLQNKQEYMKRANAHYKKYKTMKGFEDMGDAAAAHIAELEKRDSAAFGEGWTFSGGSVVMNMEDNRIQIFFDEKPEGDIRQELKSNGFKWAPSKNAWQRQLNENGIRALRYIARIQPEEKAEME